MDSQLLIMILGYVLVPISSVVTFYAGRHARHNENLSSFQNTMDELLKRNVALSVQVTELNSKVVELSHENRQLKLGQEQMLAELAILKESRKTQAASRKIQDPSCKSQDPRHKTILSNV